MATTAMHRLWRGRLWARRLWGGGGGWGVDSSCGCYSYSNGILRASPKLATT